MSRGETWFSGRLDRSAGVRLESADQPERRISATWWSAPLRFHAADHGSTNSTSVPEKSRTFRVATVMPRERAIAAI